MTCTQCHLSGPGPGLKIDTQTLCVQCGAVWTLPKYPMFVNGRLVSLREIQRDRVREEERKAA